MSWKKGTLKELVFFQRGFDITKAEQQPGDVPVISSSGVKSFHSEAKVSGPGVVIGRKGTLGSVYFCEKDYWPHDTTLWSKSFNGNNPKFVYYFLKTLRLDNYNVGNANPTLNRNHIHDLEIRIPTRAIQSKIANILTSYDDLIENNQRRLSFLEEAAKIIYKEWFVHFRFPGSEQVQFRNDLPLGWRKGKVSDFGEVITGKTPSTKDESNFNGNIPFVKTPDMHSQTVVINTVETLTERGANSQINKYIPKGSVMVSCIGTVGVVSMTSTICQTNQQINSINFYNPTDCYYAFFALSDLKQLLKGMGGGATMGNVNKTKFSNLPVLLPDPKILLAFKEVVEPVFSQIETLLLQNEKLSEARDLLLLRLMKGEIFE